MTDEKLSIKNFFKAKSKQYGLTKEGTELKSYALKKMGKMKETNSFYEVEVNDKYISKNFDTIFQQTREFAIHNDNLYIINRINGKLESYEFLIKQPSGNFLYSRCKELQIPVDCLDDNWGYGWCLDALFEHNGKFHSKLMQIHYGLVYDLSKDQEASEQVYALEKTFEKQMRASQDLFKIINNTYELQSDIANGIDNKTVIFGRSSTYFGDETLQSSLYFKFNETFQNLPIQIYTPNAQEKFPIITRKSVIHIPLILERNGISVTLKNFEDCDIFSIPLMIENTHQIDKSDSKTI